MKSIDYHPSRLVPCRMFGFTGSVDLVNIRPGDQILFQTRRLDNPLTANDSKT